MFGIVKFILKRTISFWCLTFPWQTSLQFKLRLIGLVSPSIMDRSQRFVEFGTNWRMTRASFTPRWLGFLRKHLDLRLLQACSSFNWCLACIKNPRVSSRKIPIPREQIFRLSSFTRWPHGARLLSDLRMLISTGNGTAIQDPLRGTVTKRWKQLVNCYRGRMYTWAC